MVLVEGEGAGVCGVDLVVDLAAVSDVLDENEGDEEDAVDEEDPVDADDAIDEEVEAVEAVLVADELIVTNEILLLDEEIGEGLLLVTKSVVVGVCDVVELAVIPDDCDM